MPGNTSINQLVNKMSPSFCHGEKEHCPKNEIFKYNDLQKTVTEERSDITNK
jgi:hypothetical protein